MTTRSILITGALGGIGRATALAFAAEGAALLLVDAVPADPAFDAALRAAGAAQVEFCRTDIADEAQVARAFDRAVNASGTVDVLVNIAGIMIYKPIAELTAADWQRPARLRLKFWNTPRFAYNRACDVAELVFRYYT